MNCIITGASKVLGRAMAERFAMGGYSLYLCSRDAQTLAAAGAELAARYPAAAVRFRAADMGEKDQVIAFAEWVRESGAAVDVLINNAGQFIPGSVHNE